ncbi:MAG: hypothetical protein J1E77_00540 [Prevotella sp.]|nr:hypothetical protein [Prevotella sp.]
MERRLIVSQRRKLAVAALALLMGAWSMQSCEKTDLLEGQPSWLGNSIYERLQEEGNYTYTLRLIDDLGQKEVLSQTGSKTLFVADDNAYAEWFKGNSWGVSSYEQLSLAQKSLLLNSSMVNNAYLLELLSNISAANDQTTPEPGECMRRATAASIYDSVPRILPAEMPATVYWDDYRDKQNGILLFKDATTQPMIHFLPAYMKQHTITANDLSVLTNGVSNSVNDAWVNGKKVIERDITCKNGYIHKVDGVIEQNLNMAEIIRQNPEMSLWSKLIDRFSAPYYSRQLTEEYNMLVENGIIHGTPVDSAYVLRYFAETGTTDRVASGRTNVSADPSGKAVEAELAFDPGWNQYMYNTTVAGRDYHNDCGAMIVPTNEALAEWWNRDGRVLQDEYGSWDNVDQKTLSKLLNVNMISTFSESVPSKFESVVNDAKVQLGIKPEDVVKCYMGCNGVVYMVNRVFSPSAYASVSFPALIHASIMNVFYWAIEKLEFEPYLNSMDSYYSFFIPTNDALLRYIDPCTYGENQKQMLEFYFDYETQNVKARRYNVSIEENGEVTVIDVAQENVPDNIIENRMNDILNQMIIVGNVEDGHHYYKSKGGSPVYVSNPGVEGVMTVSGGWQLEKSQPITVGTIYDLSQTGNGKSYVTDSSLPMSTSKSVYTTLQESPEFSEFFDLLNGGDPDSTAYSLLTAQLGSSSSAKSCVDQNIKVFDTYNYTVYVPTNQVIRKLIDDGILPTWEDFEEQYEIYSNPEDYSAAEVAAAKEAAYVIKNRIVNFMRYHIQDNSVFVSGEPQSEVQFETAKLNPENGRYFSLTVTADDNSMKITDQLKRTVNVTMNNGLYNKVCREYWFQGAGNTRTIYTSNDAVIQQVDGALFYDADQLKPWKDELKLRRK